MACDETGKHCEACVIMTVADTIAKRLQCMSRPFYVKVSRSGPWSYKSSDGRGNLKALTIRDTKTESEALAVVGPQGLRPGAHRRRESAKVGVCT